MYKSFTNKRVSLIFNIFPETAKNVSKVYYTGIRNWETANSKNYSIVLGTFRIIFEITKFPLVGDKEV